MSQKKIKELEKENRRLKKLLETRKRSRYSTCFGLFKKIAETKSLGQNTFGMLMAKQKSLKAFDGRRAYLKSMSDKKLKEFEDFLKWIAYNSNGCFDHDKYLRDRGYQK